jgi:Tfp pilus assembly protein PilN
MAVGIGIELGPSGLRAAVLEREGARLMLRAVHELACDTASPATLARALSELRQALRVSGPAVLGVPSTSAILAAVSPLIAVPQRADLAVRFELQQFLPFDVTEAAWHYHWISNGHTSIMRSGFRVGGSGQKPVNIAPNSQPLTPNQAGVSHAIVAAMRRSLLEERLAACRQAGWTISAVAVNPVAALNAWDAQRGRAAAGGTSLLLVHDERTAEWVIRIGSTLQVIPISADSGDRLGADIAASWESLRAQIQGVPVPVWAAASPEAVARLKQQAGPGAPPLEVFELSRVAETGGASIRGGAGALPALGLALQALGTAPVVLNLLESSQQDAHGRLIRRAATAINALFLTAAIAFGVSGMLELRARQLEALHALDRREKLYQTLRPEIRAQLQRQERLGERSGHLDRLAADASVLTRVLAQIASTLPDSVWLTSVDVSKNGILNGMLEGRATSFQDVTQFFDRLKSAAGMTTVKPLSTSVKPDETTGKEVIAFSVQIQRPLFPSGEAPESPQSTDHRPQKSGTPR